MAVLENVGSKVAKMCWGQQVLEVFPGKQLELVDERAVAWIMERYPSELRLVTNETRPTAQAEIPPTTPRRRGRPARKTTTNSAV